MDGPQVSSVSIVNRVVYNIRRVIQMEHQIPRDHILTIVVLVFTRDITAASKQRLVHMLKAEVETSAIIIELD